MRFDSFNINNKFVKLSAQKIDFSCKGVYVISGNNGTGKSSLIKEIVFGKQTCSFPTPVQEEAYRSNRGSVISYVPQEIFISNFSIINYIKKDNPEINDVDVINYLRKFDMNQYDLKTKIKVLSGGERLKLCIIAALLKKTPYLILDEPTNNFDDTSTSLLVAELEKYAENRTVILVTHDPRVAFVKSYSVLVDESGINQDYSDGTKNYSLPCEFRVISGWKLISRLLGSLHNAIAVAAFILILLAIMLFNLNEFLRGYSYDNSEPIEGIIRIYTVDRVYPNLNENYVIGARLSIKESEYETLLRYDDIPQIYRSYGVEQLYILSEYQYNTFLDSLFVDNKNAMTISIPNAISQNYLEDIFDPGLFGLVGGRAPDDQKNEIALSKKLFIDLVGNYIGTDIIGSKVRINGKQYTVVGLTALDMFWISYTDSDDSLFYKYNVETYDSFKKKEIAYKESEEYANVFEPLTTIMVTEPSNEKLLLDYLMSSFPANNYDSYQYGKVWVNVFNFKFLKRIILLTSIFTLIGVVILSVMNRVVLNEDCTYLNDYRCYYIFDKRIKTTYFVSRILIRICVLAMVLIVDTLLSEMFLVNAVVLLFVGIILLLIDSITALIHLNKSSVI